jgi:hypothetical protein
VWVYRLDTRTDNGVVEYALHLDGVGDAANPGDVRVVIEDERVRMRGPATDHECVQFPADLDLGLAFLSPDDIADPERLARSMEPVSAETIAGSKTMHYAVRSASVDGWRDMELDVWLDVYSGAVLRHDLRANGRDTFFGAGEGALSGQFLVQEIGPQAIQPIEGCEIDLPLPGDAARIAKLPGGLIVFDSLASPSELAEFYQDELPEDGWELLAGPQASDGTIILSYSRIDQTLDIMLEPSEDGAHAELLLGDE